MLSLCAVLCYTRAEAPHDNRGQWVIGRCENPLVDLPYRDQLGAGTGQGTFLRPLESMHFGFRAMTYQRDQRLAKLGPAAEKHWRQVMALLSEEIEF
ncbi:MAG: hypothetical protein ACO3DT_09895 [Gammaproteobacteria bacterium]